MRQGALGVALTGSAARGTSTAGSDLDLWVLGPPESRRHLRAEGVNVTLLTHTPREALSLDTLSFWEVDDLQVLADPHGHFRRIQLKFDAFRDRLRRDVLVATREDLEREFRLAGEGTSWTRLLFLRQAGLRLAQVWLYLRTGWRVPRYRVLLSHLPAPSRKRLERLLLLPHARQARQALDALPLVAARTRRWLTRRGVDVRGLQVPRELAARRAAGEVDEAVLLARRFLVEVLVPTVLSVGGVYDVAALGLAPRGLREVLFGLQSFSRLAPGDDAAVQAAAREIRTLVEDLSVGPSLGAPLRRALARLGHTP
ncbi:MAG: nucleotidyltransferase domain-containing protein [Myxococcota bacterium]